MDMGFTVPIPINDNVFSASPTSQAGKWNHITL